MRKLIDWPSKHDGPKREWAYWPIRFSFSKWPLRSPFLTWHSWFVQYGINPTKIGWTLQIGRLLIYFGVGHK
jgi:hypothetical protein